MSGNVRPPEPDRLPPRQRRAVDLMLTGQPDTAVAAAVGVRPRTVRRWRKLPAFRAALRAGLVAAAEARAESSSALLAEALRVVAKAVAAGDVRAALRVIALPHLAEVAVDAEARKLADQDARRRAITVARRETADEIRADRRRGVRVRGPDPDRLTAAGSERQPAAAHMDC